MQRKLFSRRKLWVLPMTAGYPAVIEIDDAKDRDLEVREKFENEMKFDINLCALAGSDLFYLDYCQMVRYRAIENAYYIASVIYYQHARTGKLLDAMPKGMPKDPFSGKDFLLIKTEEGFKIKCQGSNLFVTKTNKVHEFKFAIREK